MRRCCQTAFAVKRDSIILARVVPSEGVYSMGPTSSIPRGSSLLCQDSSLLVGELGCRVRGGWPSLWRGTPSASPCDRDHKCGDLHTDLNGHTRADALDRPRGPFPSHSRGKADGSPTRDPVTPPKRSVSTEQAAAVGESKTLLPCPIP